MWFFFGEWGEAIVASPYAMDAMPIGSKPKRTGTGKITPFDFSSNVR
jgi:hypothetical protein